MVEVVDTDVMLKPDVGGSRFCAPTTGAFSYSPLFCSHIYVFMGVFVCVCKRSDAQHVYLQCMCMYVHIYTHTLHGYITGRAKKSVVLGCSE